MRLFALSVAACCVPLFLSSAGCSSKGIDMGQKTLNVDPTRDEPRLLGGGGQDAGAPRKGGRQPPSAPGAQSVPQ